MADAAVLDRAFQAIMRGLVESGRALHHTELARALGCEVEDGRRVLHEVMQAFFPGWLYPETDYIASFPPFNNLPTQYRITVDGQQKWFAQCGFESLSVTWFFPGRRIRIDAPCLDCGGPMVVEMQDGRFHRVEPSGIVGHMNQPWNPVKERLAFL